MSVYSLWRLLLPSPKLWLCSVETSQVEFSCMHCDFFFFMFVSSFLSISRSDSHVFNQTQQRQKSGEPASLGVEPSLHSSLLTFKLTQTQVQTLHKLNGKNEFETGFIRLQVVFGFVRGPNRKDVILSADMCCTDDFYCGLPEELFICRGWLNSFPADCGHKTFFMGGIAPQPKTTGG